MAGSKGTMTDRDELIERLKSYYHQAGSEVPSAAPRWLPGTRVSRGWLQPVLASLALVVVAGAVAVGVRTARDNAGQVKPTPTVSPSPSATPSPSAASSWVSRVPLGQVTAMSTDASAVYALYLPAPASGAGNPAKASVARIDRATGMVATAAPFPGATQVARVDAGLWISGGDQATGAGPQWMTLVDPISLKVKHRTELPRAVDSQTSPLAQLAGTANLLWVGYGHALYRLDPASGNVALTRALPANATSVSIDRSGTRLYVGVDAGAQPNSQAMVIEWDASTGTQLASTTTGGAGLGGPYVAAAGDGVWIAYATGTQGAVEHRSASGLTILPGSSQPGQSHSNGIRVYVVGSFVWFVDRMAQEIACGNSHTGAQGATSQVTLPQLVIGDGTAVYLGDAAGVGPLRPDAACPR
jgi:hypothetical protein